MDFTTAFRRERRHIYLITVLGILGCVQLLDTVRYSQSYSLISFLISGAWITAMLLIIRFHRKKAVAPVVDDASENLLHGLFDRYARRCVIWLLIVLLQVLDIVLGMMRLNINFKTEEMLGTLSDTALRLMIFSFFLTENLLKLRWLRRQHSFERLKAFRKELKFILLSSAIYLLLAVALCYGFERAFVLDITAFAASTFAVWIVIYNFTRLNRFTYSRKKHARAVIAIVLSVAVLIGGYGYLSRDIWLTQPYINTVPYLYEGKSTIAYDESTGVFTITKPYGDFRILQLTDIHLSGGVLSFDKDLKAIHAVYDLLKATKPDLVIVTGDLSYPVGLSSFSFNNTAPVQQFAAFMRNTGIPWAFTYGNHDTESYAAATASSLQSLYQSLSWNTSRTLLYPYVQPDISGRNNQLIEIRNSDGSLNQAIFLIDSNAYTGEGFNKYDYIHDDQVEWYREQVLRLNASEQKTVPSLVFFHIPLQQYQTAYDLYRQGSDQVRYFFGFNGEAEGHEVACSEHPSKMFDVAKELGSTTGFFCGHDHRNNISLEYEGIRLTYGMSIDYLATFGIARETKQRGGTLITIHNDGSTDICQVPLSTVASSD